MTSTSNTTRIVVIGGSYGGVACVNQLMHSLPKSSKVAIILIESRDARHHCIATYRALVQEEFVKNLWIPYTHLFPEDSPHKVVRGTVQHVFNDHVLLSSDEIPSLSDITLSKGSGDSKTDPRRVDFDYLVIAIGSMVPSPAKMKVKSSAEGLSVLKRTREDIKQSERIVIVGGGACGVEMAGEIKYAFPSKTVTLIHASSDLVNYPGFPKSFKNQTRHYLEKQGVDVILNETAEIPGLSREYSVQRAEKTITLKESGRTIESDLQILSIGMEVDTTILSTLRPPSQNDPDKATTTRFDFKTLLDPKSKAVLVKSTLQLKNDAFPNIFAIGDVSKADPVPTCMSAISSGQTCARNIVKLIHKAERSRVRRGSEAEDNSQRGSEDEIDGYLCRSWTKLEDYVPIRPLMVLAMNPLGGVCHLPVLGSWFGGVAAWLVKSGDLMSGRFWREMNMPRP
ncbi:Apoptosis-inducing factor 2 [Dissophora globulifera]|nr:Apoptosis-inducing factor 2 [Dissophora globulifera]